MRYSRYVNGRAGTGAVVGAIALVSACVLVAAAPLRGGAQATGSITGIVTMDNPPAPSTVEVNADAALPNLVDDVISLCLGTEGTVHNCHGNSSRGMVLFVFPDVLTTAEHDALHELCEAHNGTTDTLTDIETAVTAYYYP